MISNDAFKAALTNSSQIAVMASEEEDTVVVTAGTLIYYCYCQGHHSHTQEVAFMRFALILSMVSVDE